MRDRIAEQTEFGVHSTKHTAKLCLNLGLIPERRVDAVRATIEQVASSNRFPTLLRPGERIGDVEYADYIVLHRQRLPRFRLGP